MRRKRRRPQEIPKEYSVQATPFILRDLGWDFIKSLAEEVYSRFKPEAYRPLIFRPDGVTGIDTSDNDPGNENVEVFFASLKEISDSDSDKMLMIVPYKDKDGIKVLYFKWADETYYDSFTASDGQNKVWDNKE